MTKDMELLKSKIKKAQEQIKNVFGDEIEINLLRLGDLKINYRGFNIRFKNDYANDEYKTSLSFGIDFNDDSRLSITDTKEILDILTK